jgi:alanyl-tRNA synthetase
VTFVCGRRALQALQAKTQILERVTRRLTVGEDQLADGIERLLNQHKQQQIECKALEKQLRVKEARALHSQAQMRGEYHLVTATIGDRDAKAAHALGLQITANPKTVCIIGVLARRATLIVGQSEDGPLDLKALAPFAASLLEGKGGGNNRQIQVSGPHVSQLAAAVQTLAEHIREKIKP